MKLRIQGNSIRLRLTRTEVERFGKEGIVKESVHFGSEMAHHFHYEIRVEPNINVPDVSYNNQTIQVMVPKAVAQQWANTDEVGFEHEVNTGKDPIHLLVEKDFQCLHRDNTEEPDNYAHPLAG